MYNIFEGTGVKGVGRIFCSGKAHRRGGGGPEWAFTRIFS